MVDSPSDRRYVPCGVALLERRDRTMFGGNDTSDKALQKSVARRLERSGAGATGLTITVQRGSVNVSGKLHHESQRLTIIKALRGVSGVRSVVDQLRSPPQKIPQGS
jgi:osmotically-inducible protein OsmY